ncbi:MAG: hypothetical protein AAGD22_15440 [Verrucomicrobiota bacterium]
MRRIVFAMIFIAFPAFPPPTAEAGPGGGGSSAQKGGRSGLHKQFLDNQYRPRASFANLQSESVTKKPILPLIINYSVPVGFVGEVYLFINNTRAATYEIPENSRKGRLQVNLDLSPYGPGTHSLRLGAAQGLPGKQALTKQQLFGTKVTYRP